MQAKAPHLIVRRLAPARQLFAAIVLLSSFAAGFWILNQVLDAALFLRSGYTALGWSGTSVDVWMYHDYAYLLLWVAYLGFATWTVAPWKTGHLTNIRVLAMLFGFAVLTAGLWLAQDAMNASLVLGRNYVDLPFFLGRLDLYQTRDFVNLAVPLGYFGSYSLSRVPRAAA